MINQFKLISVSDLVFPIIITVFLYVQNQINETVFLILIPASILIGTINLKFQPINRIIELFIIKNKNDSLKNNIKENFQQNKFNEIIQSKYIKTEEKKISTLVYSICIIMLIFVLQLTIESNPTTVTNSVSKYLFSYDYQWFFIQFFLFTLEIVMISKFLSLAKILPEKIINQIYEN